MVALSSATLLLFFFLSSCFINVQASSSQPCIFECPPNLTPVPYPVPKPREPTIPSFCYDPSATKFTQCCERLDRCFADCGAKFESCYDKLFLCFHSTCTRNKIENCEKETKELRTELESKMTCPHFLKVQDQVCVCLHDEL